MANQLLRLDLNGVEYPNPIVKGHIKDGEIKTVDVLITDNSIPKDLTTFVAGQFRGTNSQGEFVTHDIAVTSKDGKFSCVFPKTAFSRAGKFKQAYFAFTNKSGGQISTGDFDIIVTQDADADATHADTLVDEYNKYVKQLQDAYDKYTNEIEKDVTELEQRITTNESNFEKDIQNKEDAFEKTIQDKEADFNKAVTDLKAKIDALKKQFDTLDVYTKSQADNRFLITNVGTIGADTDWNTANSQGIYMVNAAKGANCPTGTSAVWGNLLVIKVGATIEQLFLGATTGGKIYTRSYYGSPATWGKWYTIITDAASANWQMQKIFKDNDFTLATCPKGTDFGDFLKSNSVPVGFSIIRDNNTAMNAMIIKENNKYIYAYSSNANNASERFTVNNGVASGWMRSLNANDIVSAKLTPTGGATDPCVMTVIGETLVNLQFNGRYPVKGGQAIYWIDAKYAPKGNGVSFAIPHNNVEGTQVVISIGTNGAVILVGNADDVSTAFGSYTYNCKF